MDIFLLSSHRPGLDVAQYDKEELKVVLVCEPFYLLFMEDKRSIANRCLGSGPGHLSQDSDFHPGIWLLVEGHPHSRAHDRSISINQFSGLLKPSRASPGHWTESPDS